jgi:hypothetical protein
VLFELLEGVLEGVLGGAATRLQVGTAKISLASRNKEKKRGNMDVGEGDGGQVLPFFVAYSKTLYIKRLVRTT